MAERPRPSVPSALLQPGFLIGLACTAVFLVLAVRHVDWAQTGSTLRAARWGLVALGTAMLVATYAVFAVRSCVLLADTARIRVRDAFAYIMIGYLANAVLPLRLGDVTRAALLGRRYRVETARVLASVVTERVLDVNALLLVAVAVSSLMELPPFALAGLRLFAGLGLATFAGLALAANAGVDPARWAERVPGRLGRRAAALFFGRLSGFTAGLATLRRPRAVATALALSAVAWVLAAAGTCVYVAAFRIPAPWYAGMFVLVVVNFGTAIPSSPGFVGVYHFLAVRALGAWAPDPSAALAYAIGTHALNVVVNVVLGAVYLAREGLTLGFLRTVPGEELRASDRGMSRE